MNISPCCAHHSPWCAHRKRRVISSVWRISTAPPASCRADSDSSTPRPQDELLDICEYPRGRFHCCVVAVSIDSESSRQIDDLLVSCSSFVAGELVFSVPSEPPYEAY
ncbi:hypothetical protein Q1695_003288 [Nippostrongylus brasiliensis]|nr:hypothetical protein Q1695_003288 [Nippostrongylus brasiliensis]